MNEASGATPSLTKAAMGISEGLPLTVSDGGIEELRKDIQRLMDIEAIKQLKHAYFRCLDTCNLDEFAELFTENVHIHYVGGLYEWKLDSKEEMLSMIKQSFHREAVGHHNAHTPEIQMLSETEATGIWYFCDNMYLLNHQYHVTGSGIYYDKYEKVGSRWFISSTQYRRIYEYSGALEEKRDLTDHYLGKYGPPPPA